MLKEMYNISTKPATFPKLVRTINHDRQQTSIVKPEVLIIPTEVFVIKTIRLFNIFECNI